MLVDQEQTERQTKPQTGSCLHCHITVGHGETAGLGGPQ
jgi:hypothetical protein